MIRIPNLVNPEQLMNSLCCRWLAQPSLLIPVPKPRIYYWTKPSNAVGDDGNRIENSYASTTKRTQSGSAHLVALSSPSTASPSSYTVNQSVSSSFISTSTTTSTTAPSSNSMGTAFRFKNIGEVFKCGTSLVEWTYSGPEAPMSLNITNVDVPQLAPLSNSSATTSTTDGVYFTLINEQIATQLDPLMENWLWSSKNIPQGWYQMLATVLGVIDASSPSFFVQNGTAVDCVLQSSSAPTPTPMPMPAVTVLTKTITATQVPSTTPSSPKAISHTRAVAGGIAGGAAAVILVILIIVFARRRGRQDHMRRKSVDPSSLHYRTGPVGMSIVPLNPGSPPAMPVPVGLSNKELAQLRWAHTAEHTPVSSSAIDSLPAITTSSPLIVVTAGQGEVTPQTETDIQSEVEYLRREVLRLHAQQVRAEEFQAPPPSYGEARAK